MGTHHLIWVIAKVVGRLRTLAIVETAQEGALVVRSCLNILKILVHKSVRIGLKAELEHAAHRADSQEDFDHVRYPFILTRTIVGSSDGGICGKLIRADEIPDDDGSTTS